MEHTPTPWKVNNVFIENAENQYFVSEAKWGGANIAACGSSVSGDWDINEANAHYIVKAVNNHEELVEVIQGLLSSVAFGDMGVFHDKPYYLLGDGDPVIKKAKAILQRLALP